MDFEIVQTEVPTSAMTVRQMGDLLASKFAAAPKVASVASLGNGEVVVEFNAGYKVEFFADRFDRETYTSTAARDAAITALVDRFAA